MADAMVPVRHPLPKPRAGHCGMFWGCRVANLVADKQLATKARGLVRTVRTCTNSLGRIQACSRNPELNTVTPINSGLAGFVRSMR